MTTAKLVYADDSGQIYDHPYLEMAGSSGGSWQRVDDTFLVPLPPGSELFLLLDRVPVGYDRDNQRFAKLGESSLDPGQAVKAVAAFMAPARQFYHCSVTPPWGGRKASLWRPEFE
jgi:hypothetical protein